MAQHICLNKCNIPHAWILHKRHLIISIDAEIPKDIYRFKATSIKIPISFFTGVKGPKHYMRPKENLDSSNNPKQRSKAGDVKIPDLKVYDRDIIIKTVWHWHKNRHGEQRDKTQGTNMSTVSFSHLILDKDAKSIS